MKRIHPEDPRVTAHALGELPAHEAAEIERAAGTNPAIRLALEETHALASLVKAGYRTESHELGEARREAIRRAGRRPVPENLVSMNPGRRWVRPALAAAAAVLVFGVVWMIQQVPRSEDGLTAMDREAAQRADLRTQLLLSGAPRPRIIGQGSVPAAPVAPGAAPYHVDEDVPTEIVKEEYHSLRQLLRSAPDAFEERVRNAARTADGAALGKLPHLADNPFVPTREQPSSTVPIISGRASFPLVDRFVRAEGKLPPKNGVRIEELINHLVYEDEGDADLGGVKLGAELVKCPWDSGAILMGVLLHNGSEQTIPPDALLRIDVRSARIRSHRLIGYAGGPEAGGREASLRSGLAPGRSNLVLYQLQPLESEVFDQHRVVAQVGLRLGDENTSGLLVPVASPPRDWENASNNLQTAAILAGWGMLLRESPYRGTLTPDALGVLATAAQAGGETGDLARREALQLVLDSLPLLERVP